ncbi:MAG: DegT/DnrJ/EryC1/StrS family aminotransferase, partial [Actinobacteria bacterium]|nr:DegT/DnrJ/EryC1/StrS family aminotransferase [Actinomycetota bacterium]
MPYFIIDIFNPPHYNFSALHLKQIEALLGHNSFYASKGCWAFYHCLKSLGVNDQILMPSYICNSIQKPLQILNIKPIYYDIDPDDLNADISSIQFLAKKFHIKALLIASMYGNPANLFEIDLFCKTNGIKLIDDAAQSTGASINNKPIGSFGQIL